MKKRFYFPISAIFLVAITGCSQNSDMKAVETKPVIQNCVPEAAAKLVGKTELSEAEIKAITQAEIVRMVAPDQPVTMDYRMNRVTVVIDPKTRIIVQASCG
ncbi:I78 family peptidase inhibitor [Acinetobacter towneri]|nr:MULTISPECIES: I78 family peptidase inhibitor [Acinetobacter]MDM1487621.1 hemolysin [Acinetobacter towneri]MEB6564651.1 I78 family peptidase inhibitor [Acinetobacter towneri]